ncbi:hypothetical protein GM658_05920 [Pseudoduganella eburnea]|uniref:Uncharacterized protein n=1 Tax=Massilia eburnea TaxID=1776165 RepID=A0A6L6QDL8_9BURK|nr:hypothetical protein [Massilia eburnea]MTW10134.1 hypothetical protein [Massilia eburnea]
MTISSMHDGQSGRSGGTAYTVVCKSGQRGTEYSDPDQAAQAFFRAQEQDRPFVLRHRGNATLVIASARAGAKQIAANWAGDDQFRSAYESLLRRE